MAQASPSCPICRRALPSGKLPPTHPFCSERCKLIDLGNWLGDGYVISGPALGDPLEAMADLDDETLAALIRERS